MKTIGEEGAAAALKAMDNAKYTAGIGVPALVRLAVAEAFRSLAEQAYEREDALVVDMSDIYDIADALEQWGE